MSARDEAVEMIRRICPPHLSRDEYGRILAEKFDAYAHELAEQIRHHYGVGGAPIRAHCNPDCEYCLAAARAADLIDPEAKS